MHTLPLTSPIIITPIGYAVTSLLFTLLIYGYRILLRYDRLDKYIKQDYLFRYLIG